MNDRLNRGLCSISTGAFLAVLLPLVAVAEELKLPLDRSVNSGVPAAVCMRAAST